ncbi:HD domain-containing protein [Chloracidobacterium thermophilum]|uniref:HD domain-containing protein n=1 Tax=Chloracidobacterium thermophilum TaxID=458033 RepID=UPI0007389903|nr:HD domain-containing protein [Chloracidobacterium thermophilum]
MSKPVKTFTTPKPSSKRLSGKSSSRLSPRAKTIRAKTIRDAVHGDMTFSAAEVRLLDTQAMQRLRGIKQLGLSHLVYPSAMHTRFEHSLGACHLAGKIIESLEQRGVHRFTEDERQRIRTVALLHDITHVPFGHTFEDERRIAPRHDADIQRLDTMLSGDLGEELERQGLLTTVRSHLLGELGETPLARDDDFIRDIFAGTICADLLDYLRRDARFCGLTVDYDDRLLALFTRLGGRLALDLQRHGLFRHDALSEVVHVLRMRYLLTERVYFHHAKIAAGAMLSKALEMAIAAGRFAYAELFALRDDAFLHVLRERTVGLPEVQRLLSALATRQLYKPVFRASRDGLTESELDRLKRQFYDNAGGAREQMEAALCDDLGLPAGSVIVYCPSPDMALKEAHVTVQLSEHESAQLSSLAHPEIETLLLRHRQLWRLVVLATPDLGRHAAKRHRILTRCCEARLALPDRSGEGPSSLLFFPANVGK